jgi:hypothetical protein
MSYINSYVEKQTPFVVLLIPDAWVDNQRNLFRAKVFIQMWLDGVDTVTIKKATPDMKWDHEDPYYCDLSNGFDVTILANDFMATNCGVRRCHSNVDNTYTKQHIFMMDRSQFDPLYAEFKVKLKNMMDQGHTLETIQFFLDVFTDPDSNVL